MKILKALLLPALFLAIFFSVALWRYFATGKIFYVYNFGYIGIAMALGLFLSNILPKEKLGVARRVAQLLIGVYLLGYVGILSREDLQIEGFWLYLFSGYFAGATLHYFVAKIAGPLIFNRGWCGWACWTAMVLDFLPWKKPRHEVNERYTAIRYAHFMIVLLSVVFLFYFTDFGQGFRKKDTVELYWLIIGNFMYYAIGIILAAALRDNRAFCKYACPIPALMKIGARFALLRNEIDPAKCIECKKCEANCPMQIRLLDYMRKGMRIRSTECILCQTCESVCPKDAIRMTFKIDGIGGGKK